MNKKAIIQQIIEKLNPLETDYNESKNFLENYEFSKSLQIKDGSLVLLKNNFSEMWYFLIAIEGSKIINYDNKVIMTITPFSPIGNELIDKKKGDLIQVKSQTFSIIEHL